MCNSDSFTFIEGELPLLISVPHDGRKLPPDMSSRMTQEGLYLPDTDWHINELYAFTRQMDVSLISADYSRYVVDLNRSTDDSALYENQRSTGLCPKKTFAGKSIYSSLESIHSREINQRVISFWNPYHEKIRKILQGMKTRYGYALLWDAHSIKTFVPNLFEGRLPDLNIGTNSGESCPQIIEDAILNIALNSTYSVVTNERFKGGYITRNYGNPMDQIYAIQLEIAQSCYMNETSLTYDTRLAKKLTITLERMLEVYMSTAKQINIKK